MFFKLLKRIIMKYIFLFLASIFSLVSNSQNYLISFTGSGASSTVSNIKVDNLTDGTSLTLNQNDVLRLTIATSFDPAPDYQSDQLKIYPNPMIENSTFEFYPPYPGAATITVIDMTGKTFVIFDDKLESSVQSYRLSGLKSGFYLINIKANNYHLSGKLLSKGGSKGLPAIEKVRHSSLSSAEEIKITPRGIQATVDMDYTPGDRLMFTGISGAYTTIKTDIPSSDKTIDFEFIACTDGDNINYPVVKIGTQIWMADNLKTSKYLNGDLIGTTTPATLNIFYETNSKYQWAYSGTETNAAAYGRLYTWFTATDSRKVCPSGWHLPSLTETSALYDYLAQNGFGFEGVSWKTAKSISSTTGWNLSTNAGAPGNDQPNNNSTGFSALPGGYRSDYGWFSGIGNMTYWWCSSQSGDYADATALNFDQQGTSGTVLGKKTGCSVRCLKD
jgi:uncharacterized protein (TIGR02145 family)